MRQITFNEGAATASAGKLTIGLDLADSFTQLCIIDGERTVVSQERVRTTTPDLQRRFSALPPARVVLEAGTHSPWVSRVLAQLGHEAIVANARHVQLIGYSYRKSDRSDAEQLARLGRLEDNKRREPRSASASSLGFSSYPDERAGDRQRGDKHGGESEPYEQCVVALIAWFQGSLPVVLGRLSR